MSDTPRLPFLLLLLVAFPLLVHPQEIPKAWRQPLDLRGKVAQLIVTEYPGEPLHVDSSSYRRLQDLVANHGIGGIILINPMIQGAVKRSGPYAVAAFFNRMQRQARIPLLIGGDFERGPSMRLDYTTPFPHAMAFAAARDLEAARFAGATTAREARAMGVNWIFSPVADVNNNPANPVIGIRSFSEQPDQVIAYVKAFLEGVRSVPGPPLLTNVKHFPGHGDTDIDSHSAMPSIDAKRERLDQVELRPFQAAIEAGVDSIMSAHVAVTAVGEKGVPATLSQPVLTGLLRDQLGYQGLIVTDALNMGAITSRFHSGEMAVRAIEAGADVLLMPPDPVTAIDAVVSAVQSGVLTEKRIDESLERVLRAKARAGLAEQKLIDIEAIATVLPSPEADGRARRVAEKAVTALRNNRNAIQTWRGLSNPCAAILLTTRISRMGLTFRDELDSRRRRARIQFLYPEMSKPEALAAARSFATCKAVVVADFTSAVRRGAKWDMPGALDTFATAVAALPAPTIWVPFANPYAGQYIPPVSGYVVPFSSVPVSESAVVRALTGEIAIGGRTPISVPGTAQYGDGLDIPAGH